jgi:ubiquinone/menaquinone biosynthesis C-methylase UbiE
MVTNASDNNVQNNPWDSAETTESWRHSTAERTQLLEKATELMLKAAEVRNGSRMLDIAAGTGDQTFLAAKLVGPTGNILATDLSANMLKVLDESAQQKGLTNIATSVMDAQNIDLPPNTFDSVISRFGLMFLSNLQQALSGIYNVLKNEGKFAALVWSRPENNPTFALPMAISYRYSGNVVPNPGTSSGLFSLSDPVLLIDAFQKAGFREVNVQKVALVHRFASVEEFIRTHGSSGPIGEVLNKLSESERKQVQTEIIQTLRQFQGSDGFEAPGESLLVVGTK